MTPEEGRLPLELSLDPKTHKKTRLRAMMAPLAAEGWTAPQLAEPLAERLGVRLAPKVVSRHPRAMGYVWVSEATLQRMRCVPAGKPGGGRGPGLCAGGGGKTSFFFLP
ncbi:hypothetical protein TthSNM33_21490 (plasmid) [Thermus thermophilus]|nr:hypothetical protein TthSNM33_21490 [Thermus thermophilus]